MHVTELLNNALDELLDWCRANSLFSHPKECEAMFLLLMFYQKRSGTPSSLLTR